MSETAGNAAAWLGKTESRSELIGPNPAQGFAALLDRPAAAAPTEPASPLPPLWHWLYFLEMTRQSEIAADGHARKGGFLPPIDLPRRMWAGSRFRFHHPLRIGETVTRRSRIDNIEFKQGRSGQLAFVRLAHEYDSPTGVAFSELHEIVYREALPAVDKSGSGGGVHPETSAAPAPEAPATKLAQSAPEADFERETRADAVMLFRYSALTFNAHRIHYDRDYVRDMEGYPGLLVHGPLLATLLLEELLGRCPGRELREFSFRALAPVFDTDDFRLCGRWPDAEGRCPLWVAKADGTSCIRAEAMLAPAT